MIVCVCNVIGSFVLVEYNRWQRGTLVVDNTEPYPTQQTGRYCHVVQI